MSLTYWSKVNIQNVVPQRWLSKYRTDYPFYSGWSIIQDTYGTTNTGSGSAFGYKDTDWRVKISKQANASNAYKKAYYPLVKPFLLQSTAKRWDATYANRLHIECIWSNVIHYAQTGTPTDSVLRDQALARFKRKLQNEVGNYQAAVPLAQVHELRGLIHHATDLTGDFLRKMKAFRRTKGRSLLNFLQKNWLAYSFGIAPTISDISQASQSVNDFLRKKRSVKRISASASKRENASAKYEDFSGNHYPYNYVYVDTSIERYLQYTFTAGIDFRFFAGNNYGILEHLGLGNLLAELPSIGWELIPYSWVIDYFTTIGDYLEDTFVLPSGSTIYLCESRKFVATGRECPRATPTARTNHISYNVVDGKWTYIDFERSVLTNLPHRSLRFRTVDEIGRNALNKVLNLASLLRLDLSGRLARRPGSRLSAVG